MVDRFIEDGVLTTEEHDELMAMVHADGKIDDDEKAEISRIFKLIQQGTLKVVDPDREASEQRRKDEVRKKLLGNKTEPK
jgi:CBS domain containing-hemolysin-like protein